MFGAGKTEDVKIGDLETELRQSFDGKVAWLEKKGAGTVAALEGEIAAFLSACDALDRVESDPDVSDLFRVSMSSVKSQKPAYTKALRQAASGRRKADGGLTIYAKYGSELESIDDSINNVLQANTQFKHVFFGYSKYLGAFKGVFRRIEHLRDSLKKELERASSELEPYEETLAQVEKLLTIEDEISTLDGLLSGANRDADGGGAQNPKDESQLAEKIDKLHAERDALHTSAKNIMSRISTELMPLGRAARKYDYISKQKVKLTAFIDSPLEKIADSRDYSVFRGELLKLKDALITDKVDVGNAEEAIAHIEEIMQRDIYGEMEELKGIQGKMEDVGEEAHLLEKSLEEVRKGNRSAREHTAEFARIKEELAAKIKEKAGAKAAAEGLFLKNYGKKINMVDG